MSTISDDDLISVDVMTLLRVFNSDKKYICHSSGKLTLTDDIYFARNGRLYDYTDELRDRIKLEIIKWYKEAIQNSVHLLGLGICPHKRIERFIKLYG